MRVTASETTAPEPIEGARTTEIRKVAAKLFEVSGYSATTISDVADAAGILPGSLYHHFRSKEDLALSILAEFDREMSELISRAESQLTSLTPEERVRYLADAVCSLSLAHGAAIQLRAYAAPTVATEQLSSAIEFKNPGLTSLWRSAIAGLVPADDPRAPDLKLLRFALDRLTFHAALTAGGLDAVIEPADRLVTPNVGQQVCDLLLDGIVIDCPDDVELDRSTALQAAKDSVRAWPRTAVQGDGSRGDIVAAAREAFALRGYDATTIRDIAESAQVRMGTLYRRVDSKEDILAEILTQYSNRIHSALKNVMEASSSVATYLDGSAYVTTRAKRYFRQESDIVKLGIRSHAFETRPFKMYLAQSQERLSMLNDFLDRGAAEGSIRSIGTTAEIAPIAKSIMWLPFQDWDKTSAPRAGRFLRRTLLRGLRNG